MEKLILQIIGTIIGLFVRDVQKTDQEAKTAILEKEKAAKEAKHAADNNFYYRFTLAVIKSQSETLNEIKNFDPEMSLADYIQMLNSINALVVVDYKTELVDFEELLFGLETMRTQYAHLPRVNLNPEDGVLSWVKDLDFAWKPFGVCLVSFEDDSDAYNFFPVDLKSLNYYIRWSSRNNVVLRRMVEPDPLEITKVRFDAVTRQLEQKTQRDVIELAITAEPGDLFDSKFGGLPYLARNQEVVRDANGTQMRLLAQINFRDIEVYNSSYPHQGMLQFWVVPDDMYGLRFPKDRDPIGHKVVYHRSIDTFVNEKDVGAKYDLESLTDTFPFEGSFKLAMKQGVESISTSDFQHWDLLLSTWNALYPNDFIISTDELDDFIDDTYYERHSGSGSKFGGYPFFTQEDPRTDDDLVLLLQIDSDRVDDRWLMWGDCGVANFFISKDDLAQQNFENVLYNWDCS